MMLIKDQFILWIFFERRTISIRLLVHNIGFSWYLVHSSCLHSSKIFVQCSTMWIFILVKTYLRLIESSPSIQLMSIFTIMSYLVITYYFGIHRHGHFLAKLLYTFNEINKYNNKDKVECLIYWWENVFVKKKLYLCIDLKICEKSLFFSNFLQLRY